MGEPCARWSRLSALPILIACALSYAGCASDGVLPHGPPGSYQDQPRLGAIRFTIEMPGTETQDAASRLVPAATRTVRVTVTAQDISPDIVEELGLSAGHSGTATLQVSVPSGSARDVLVEALDASDGLLAQAGTTVDVLYAQVTQCSMTLQPENSVYPTVVATATPATCLLGEEVSFGGSASDSDGTVELYEWDFEDDGTYDWSSTSTAGTNHVYSVALGYTARLRVRDNDGLSSEATVSVLVSDGTARLLVSPVVLDFRDDLAELTLTIDDTASNPSTTLDWSISETIAWTGVSPSSGSIADGGEASVTVLCDRSAIASGFYEATFTVNSNSGAEIVTVRCIRTCATVIVE